MVRVFFLPLTRGMQISSSPWPSLVFNHYCRQIGSLQLWRHVNTSWLAGRGGRQMRRLAARPLLNPNAHLCIVRIILISFIPNHNKVWEDAQGHLRSWVPEMHLQQINCHIDWPSPEFHYCPVSTAKEDKRYEEAAKQRQLRSQQDPGWLNEDNWGHGHGKDDAPLKDACRLFTRVRRWQRKEKRRKLGMEIFIQKLLHVCIFVFFYDLVPRTISASVLTSDAQKLTDIYNVTVNNVIFTWLLFSFKMSLPLFIFLMSVLNFAHLN